MQHFFLFYKMIKEFAESAGICWLIASATTLTDTVYPSKHCWFFLFVLDFFFLFSLLNHLRQSFISKEQAGAGLNHGT